MVKLAQSGWSFPSGGGGANQIVDYSGGLYRDIPMTYMLSSLMEIIEGE